VSALHADPVGDLIPDLCRAFGGTFIVNPRLSGMNSAVDENIAERVAVVRPAIANPGLATLRQKGAGESEFDQACICGCSKGGYIDYPFIRDQPTDAGAARDPFPRGAT